MKPVSGFLRVLPSSIIKRTHPVSVRNFGPGFGKITGWHILQKIKRLSKYINSNGGNMLSQTLSGNWQFKQTETKEWLPAQVPGGVHTDLLALGRIPDPFVGDNEKKVMWIAEQDWEYRKTFTVDAGLLAEEKVFLVCD